MLSLVESVGGCYRTMLPVPVWHAWLVHASERHLRAVVSLIYLTYKLAVGQATGASRDPVAACHAGRVCGIVRWPAALPHASPSS